MFLYTWDSSAFPDRYNRFTITEQTSPDNLNAEVEMTKEGQWRYFVYANSSSSNLGPTGLLELESGIVKVTGTSTPVTSYSGGNSNYVVYGS